MKKDFISMADISQAELWKLIELARALKAARKPTQDLAGKSLGLIFQKPSTRTAVSFAVAMYELGGLPLMLNAQELQIKRGEPLSDTAKVLGRYLSGIMIRANHHADVEELARHSDVPVINGLTDKEHPCQVLGDLMTIVEKFKLTSAAGFKNVRVAYIGDGNNVAQSWMLAAAALGMEMVVCTPEGYEPEKEFTQKSQSLGAASGGKLRLVRAPAEAAAGAHVLYTDVWASMGKEAESERRREIFSTYQINGALLAQADKNAVVMHCLPAHRGEEISSDVMDGKQSVVFDQAENRLHVQKAVLLTWLKR
jgi:ornithine carbamoyltransferase